MKPVKNLIALILALVMILSFAACGTKSGNTSADTLEGSYRMVDCFGEGSSTIYKLRDGVNLEIRADNTGVLSLMADARELRFDPATKTCTSDDRQQVDYTFDGKQLILDTDPFRMVFERQ